MAESKVFKGIHLVYQDKPIELISKSLGQTGLMYQVRVLHKDGEPYLDITEVLLDEDGKVDLTSCIYGVPLKEVCVEEYETYDFNQN
tara:strand:- start:220 stop:480 length:261 start_codon:yes stop_codon:yes gene_type:complete